MSGTGGFGDDRSANKQRPLVTLPFPRLWFLACLRGKSPFPIPRREDGERRKSEADINAFSSRNATLCLHACLNICPAPGSGRPGAQTGPVNKSASGLNRGEAVIKLRPEAIAREMSGNLTKCPGEEISLRKHTLGGHEIVTE